ncbi:hypothetical protein DFH28DRAFT_1134312 [Melampsora americana]|nr:hypothetical protein DFH28DRAFT_1134312 [Melampsora americana]
MNLRILTATLVICVSVNQAIGQVIENLPRTVDENLDVIKNIPSALEDDDPDAPPTPYWCPECGEAVGSNPCPDCGAACTDGLGAQSPH